MARRMPLSASLTGCLLGVILIWVNVVTWRLRQDGIGTEIRGECRKSLWAVYVTGRQCLSILNAVTCI
jgi:hypothetical protein